MTNRGLRSDVVLASASPRRRELLALIVDDFEVLPSDVEEPDHLPEPLECSVQELALSKALAAAAVRPGSLVIGADTIVVLDEVVMNKPSDADDARRMLRALSGRTHRVMTGVAVVKDQRSATGCEVTSVTVGTISDNQLEAYVASGEPFDKAGGYGIQGTAALFIQGIEGCYFNVVGLPVYRLGKLLASFGCLPTAQEVSKQ